QQVCNYRLASVVVTKGFETCWQLGPQTLADHCLPASDEPLNPLEFHGKRRSGWPMRPQSRKQLS
ncbi:MAG: hypothetical protein ABJA49_00185, partial [Betaproteobacteria bacterium]